MNQFFNIIFKVLNMATNANPQKINKQTDIDNRLQNTQAVSMGNDTTLTLMTMKNVTSDWMSFFEVYCF